MLLLSALFSLLLILSAGYASETDNDFNAINSALELLRAGQTESAEKLFSAMQIRDVFNQCLVGVAFLKSGDVTRAVKWLKKAEDDGFMPATYFLASVYCRGVGVEKNLELADKLYATAFADEVIQSRQVLADLDEIAAAGGRASQLLLGQVCYFENSDQNNMASASFWFERAAASGCASASFYLGAMHLLGQHYECDPVRAVELFEVASGKEPWAYACLSRIFAEGAGVKVDKDRSLEYASGKSVWLADIQLGIGHSFRTGAAESRDDKKAVEWYLLAAGNGSVRACNELSSACMLGRGIDQSPDESRLWREKSISAGELQRSEAFAVKPDKSPVAGLSRTVQLLESLAEHGFSQEQLASRQLFPGASDTHVFSQEMLSGAKIIADMKILAESIPGNNEAKQPAAFSDLQAAADNGDLTAQLFMVRASKYAGFIDQNNIREMEYLRRAASNGSVPARHLLLDRLLWCRIQELAAQSGNSDAMLRVSEALADGYCGAIDRAGSIKWLKKAADSQNISACLQMGRKLLNGTDVDKNVDMAHGLLKRTADHSEVMQKAVGDVYAEAGYFDDAFQSYLVVEKAGGNMAPFAAAELVKIIYGRKCKEVSEEKADGFTARVYPALLNVDPELVAAVNALAEKGHAGSSYLRAEWLIEKSGNDRDAEVMELMRRAASGGHEKAQLHLAHNLSLSNDDDSRPEAYYWASKAARNGNAMALEIKDRLKNFMSPAELEDAEERLGRQGED